MQKPEFEQKQALPKLTLGAYHYMLERTITEVGGYRSGVARCDWERNLNQGRSPDYAIPTPRAFTRSR